MKYKIIFLTSLFFSITINGLDIPPKVQSALVKFCDQENISIKNLTFRQNESYFYQNPKEMLAFGAQKTIYLCPWLQKWLLKTEEKRQSMHPKNKLILINCLKLVNNFRDIEPKLLTILREFYTQHHIPTDTINFVQNKDWSMENPRARASAHRASSSILLSKDFQNDLLRALAYQGFFYENDPKALLHEYGHIIQNSANKLLDAYKDYIPFAIDAEHKEEAAADFYAYMTMKPSAISQDLAAFNGGFEKYNHLRYKAEFLRDSMPRSRFARFLRVRTLEKYEAKIKKHAEGVDFDDGKHVSFRQEYHLLKLAVALRKKKTEYYSLLGYTPHEIEYYWPESPRVRRIALS